VRVPEGVQTSDLAVTLNGSSVQGTRCALRILSL
jgi:hypothetical protein